MLRQNVDHLQRNADQRLNIVLFQQRCTNIYDDDNIGTHRPRNIDWQIARQSAVEIDLVADLVWRYCAGYRH